MKGNLIFMETYPGEQKEKLPLFFLEKFLPPAEKAKGGFFKKPPPGVIFFLAFLSGWERGTFIFLKNEKKMPPIPPQKPKKFPIFWNNKIFSLGPNEKGKGPRGSWGGPLAKAKKMQNNAPPHGFGKIQKFRGGLVGVGLGVVPPPPP